MDLDPPKSVFTTRVCICVWGWEDEVAKREGVGVVDDDVEADMLELGSDEEEDAVGTGPRAVSLGSRKQLCINERLKERAGDLDEACRQMLGGGQRP